MQRTNEIRKLHCGEYYEFWVTTGGRMFLQNVGKHPTKGYSHDQQGYNPSAEGRPKPDIFMIQIASPKDKLHV
jgi:hypothetical protein